MKKSVVIVIGVIVIIAIGIFLLWPKLNPENNLDFGNQEENKVVTIPANVENNCIGFLTGSPEESENIKLIGAGWARPHTGPFVWQDIEKVKGNFDFTQTDFWVKKAQEDNVTILGTIWPYAKWDQENCHSSECEVSSTDQFSEPLPISRCEPCNMEDYKTFVSKLVERYDGDGVNDMPGLKIPIKYWEILNEPELKESSLTFYKGTPENYVEILKNSNSAIKSECSDCFIVQGGAAGIMSYMLDYWKNIFDLGGANYFDIANIHYIGSGDLNTLNVKNFKAIMDEKGVSKPIWVTEAEYNSETGVLDSVTGALDAGASKIFFTRFIPGDMGRPSIGKYSEVYKDAVSKCA